MNYYKELDWHPLQHKIQEELLEHVRKLGYLNGRIPHTFKGMDMQLMLSRCPSIVTYLADLNLTPLYSTLYATDRATREINDIHTHNDTSSAARINFPILNSSRARTVFWSVDPQYTHYRIHKNGERSYVSLDPDPVELDSLRITRPTVLSAYTPHSVVLDRDGERRITMILTVDPDPVSYLYEQTGL
jgi:hypothetical protein